MRGIQEVRTLFLSDCHLGWRYSKPDAILRLLRSVNSERIYLVGDIVDGLALRKRWLWRREDDLVMQALLEKARSGVEIRYAPGNHDAFLRAYAHHFGFLQVANEFIHETADGRRLLIAHGDGYESDSPAPSLSHALGSLAYDWILWGEATWHNVCRCLGRIPRGLPAGWKERLPAVAEFLQRFARRAVLHAQELDCDGVVCGHVHAPALHDIESRIYCNTGDWVENCSAVVEDFQGTLRLIRERQSDTIVERLAVAVAGPVRPSIPWRGLQPVANAR